MKIGIVGCGTPGAYLAWKLSKENEVVVFERKDVIGKEVCSGLVSNRLWNFIPKNEGLIENDIRKVVLHFKKKDVSLKLRPEMFVLNHKSLDQYVARLAKESGAHIMTNTKVEKISEDPGLSVEANKKSFVFDRLIGCDGALSTVRNYLKIRQPEFVLGIQMFVKESKDSDSADVWPTRNGFLWGIPRGEETEYGVIEEMSAAKNLFNEFCKEKDLEEKDILSTIIPAELVSPVAKGNIALCGDAAGFTKPWSKGGILWNLTGSNLLLDSFPDFESYNKNARNFFGNKAKLSVLFKKIGMTAADFIPFALPKTVVFDSDWVF